MAPQGQGRGPSEFQGQGLGRWGEGPPQGCRGGSTSSDPSRLSVPDGTPRQPERQAPPQHGPGGEGYQGERGYAPQTQQGRRGGGYDGRVRGGVHQQQQQPQHYGAPLNIKDKVMGQGRGPSEFQGQGLGRWGEGPPQGFRGGSTSSDPSRLSVPERYQTTLAPYPAGVTPQAMSEASSSSQTPEPLPAVVMQQPQKLSVEQEDSSSKPMEYPPRPGKGSAGKVCTVKANHFLAELSDKDLHQYDVTITPAIASRRVTRAVMAQLVVNHRESHLGDRRPAFDGDKGLYTAGPFPFQTKEFKIILDNDGFGSKRNEQEFSVVIKAAAVHHHQGLFLQGRQAEQGALQGLHVVLRQLPILGYCRVGRSFYFPNGPRESLGEGLESWGGFHQSIRHTQMGFSLNVDMSSTAFIKSLPVIEFVNELLGRNASAWPLSTADLVKIKRALRGVKVEVTHRGANMPRRKYRISDLTSQATLDLKFPVDESGNLKSVQDHFSETYNTVIQHPQLPCLQVGNTKRPCYLPMEVCHIVESQRYSKMLNERQMTAISKLTCKSPQLREVEILQTVAGNADMIARYAEEFEIKISNELASVEARILPPPRLKYHDTGRDRYCLPKGGQWSMKNKRMVNGGRVKGWICVNFSPAVRLGNAVEFCRQLAITCRTFGMEFPFEPLLPPVMSEPHLVKNVLKQHCHVKNGQELNLLIVILPDNNGSLYGDVKRICETELGVVSQCCLTTKVLQMKPHYFDSVSLKINVKVGGRNTVLAPSLLIDNKATIIFGADVSHPPPGDDSMPSFAAVVASQDWPEIMKYNALVCAQPHRQEIIQDLFKTRQDPKGIVYSGMIREHLFSFYRANGNRKPDRIIFYRDGVSEGQFDQVVRHELDAIRKACHSIQSKYNPTVTFVVVQKGHHTRLFPNDLNVDSTGNILAGTVVDSKICHPTQFDFYLCSHAGITGTSHPAHYHVLCDENNFTADQLQLLTNNLCYTYAKCTRSVSIVPPVYYAHLAAFRGRLYMQPEREPSISAAPRALRPLPALCDNVKNVMFYC